MERKTNYLAVFAMVMSILFVVTALHNIMEAPETVIPEGYISPSESQLAINEAVSPLENKITELETKKSELDSKVSELNSQLAEKAKEVAEEVKVAMGYLIDKLSLGEEFSELLSDREISLIDEKVEFDGEDYNLEERLSLNDLELSIKEDFKENAYLSIPEEGLVYEIKLDSELPIENISESETLVINFLGKEIEISSLEEGKMEILSGEEYFISEGDSISFDNKSIVLEYVFDGKVYVSIDGISETIEEDEVMKINGIEIKVKEVLYSSREDRQSKAILVVSKDIKKVIESNDEYSDSVFEYFIDGYSIGVVLKEEFNELEDRKGYNVLSEGDKLCLPNDYICLEYKGLSEEEMYSYEFEYDESDEMIIIEGKFRVNKDGLDEDYSELYITEDGIFKDDDLEEEIEFEYIYLGESNLSLESGEDGFEIDDLVIYYDISEVLVDEEPLSNVEDNYRNKYGIIIESPEDSLEDNEIKIIVPEEKLEGSILIY